VVIENKAGAGGGIVHEPGCAKADGYTVLMAPSSLTVIPEADVVLAATTALVTRKMVCFTADPTAGRALTRQNRSAV
jgi:tripartite-type tricarboxylate transporter receptor subunit TctC